jgi:hypothetical protein
MHFGLLSVARMDGCSANLLTTRQRTIKRSVSNLRGGCHVSVRSLATGCSVNFFTVRRTNPCGSCLRSFGSTRPREGSKDRVLSLPFKRLNLWLVRPVSTRDERSNLHAKLTIWQSAILPLDAVSCSAWGRLWRFLLSPIPSPSVLRSRLLVAGVSRAQLWCPGLRSAEFSRSDNHDTNVQFCTWLWRNSGVAGVPACGRQSILSVAGHDAP